jgi:hypothetical protein
MGPAPQSARLYSVERPSSPPCRRQMAVARTFARATVRPGKRSQSVRRSTDARNVHGCLGLVHQVLATTMIGLTSPQHGPQPVTIIDEDVCSPCKASDRCDHLMRRRLCSSGSDTGSRSAVVERVLFRGTWRRHSR